MLGPTLDKLVGAELGLEETEGLPVGETEGLALNEGDDDGSKLGLKEIEGESEG